MTNPAVDHDLQLRLDELRRECGDMVRIDRIADVVRSILESVSGDLSPTDLRLYRELEALAGYIHEAKAEIAALRPQDVKSDYIASATDELDAIVSATEDATNEILDAAERLEAIIPLLDAEVAEKLTEATTRIYESCNFQDITGQRISKVVKALKHIEEKVDALVSVFGAELGQAPVQAPAKSDKPAATDGKPTDEDLLNGPQLPTAATDQAEIDRLLASFD